MKTGRNDPCPCGSGKKYKRCCIDAISRKHAEIFDDIAQTVAMNPNLSIDELNLVAQQKIARQNDRPNADFCGLTPTQMANWLYAPFGELTGVAICTPDNLSASPVMRYLSIILDEFMKQDGSFKSTARGNLPARLVKQASALLPEFAVAQYETEPSISKFTGSNEDKFIALHYTRVLAEIAGIIHYKGGRFYIKKAAQKQYQAHDYNVFFLPMLDAAVTRYNWSYLDGWSDAIDLRTFWLFMLWRLQTHGSIDTLIREVSTAFPDLLHQLPQDDYLSPQVQLELLIECRFIKHFLQFWGFITVNPRRISGNERVPPVANIQPLLTQTFQFN